MFILTSGLWHKRALHFYQQLVMGRATWTQRVIFSVVISAGSLFSAEQVRGWVPFSPLKTKCGSKGVPGFTPPLVKNLPPLALKWHFCWVQFGILGEKFMIMCWFYVTNPLWRSLLPLLPKVDVLEPHLVITTQAFTSGAHEVRKTVAEANKPSH